MQKVESQLAIISLSIPQLQALVKSAVEEAISVLPKPEAMKEELTEYLTTEMVANKFHVDKETVSRHAKAGKITPLWFGRKRLFHIADVEASLKRPVIKGKGKKAA
ncbi:MAG: helix-turn-helix domain-containing protein [Bacteroidota bacterium]